MVRFQLVTKERTHEGQEGYGDCATRYVSMLEMEDQLDKLHNLVVVVRRKSCLESGDCVMRSFS